MGEQEEATVCLDGAWRDFCSRLAEAGEILARPDAPKTPLEQAEGLRYLSRLTRAALNMMVDSSNPDEPRLFAICDDKVRMAADNPDSLYQQLIVKGDREYRIRGTRGTVPYLSLVSQANRYAIDGTMAVTGEIALADLELGPGGSFEIIASKARRPGNWLPMTDDTTLIVIRQTFDDKASQTPAEFHVARVGSEPVGPNPLTPELVKANLDVAAAWIRGSVNTFADWPEWFKSQPNRIYQGVDQAFWLRSGGDPRIWYGHVYFELEPGEALEIKVTPPARCRQWNFQLNNWWLELLDNSRRKSWVNNAHAKLEPDGAVIVVCADRDPGYGNWIDLAGHRRGTGLWRWIEADESPTPSCRVLRLD